MVTKDVVLDAGNLLVAAIVVYLLAETLATRARNRNTDGEKTRDGGSLVLILLSLLVALAIALLGRRFVPALELPGPVLVWAVVGAPVCVAGMALRLSAIRTLGRAYSTVVTIQPGQEVVTDGPYRLVRHPAYTGLLLMALGAGIACGHAVAIAASVALPLPALVYRIRIEEPVLVRGLGESYGAYARTKKRLIPGVW